MKSHIWPQRSDHRAEDHESLGTVPIPQRPGEWAGEAAYEKERCCRGDGGAIPSELIDEFSIKGGDACA